MKNVFLLVVFLAAQNASASSWQIVADNSVSDDVFVGYEVDLDSIQWRDGVRQAWVRFTTSPPLKVPYNPSLSYQSMISLWHCDCSLKDATMSQSHYYSGRFGTGETQYTNVLKKSLIKESMQTVVPSSYGEIILNFVCAARLKKS